MIPIDDKLQITVEKGNRFNTYTYVFKCVTFYYEIVNTARFNIVKSIRLGPKTKPRRVGFYFVPNLVLTLTRVLYATGSRH